jgi:4-amino-4-deoxy-L-arabinose transferase-like glycosyltransferase
MTLDVPIHGREDQQHIPSWRARFPRGGGLTLVGVGGLFLVMAHDARLRFGVPLGALLTAVAILGLMDLLGSFGDPALRCASRVTASEVAWPVARVVLAALGVYFGLWVGVHGALPQWVAGAALTASFIGLVASVFALGVALGPLRVDEDGEVRPLLRRHGFWLFVAMALLYLPALGMGSLTDPWETHYGEVAREVLARDDWISTWWSWEGFFYSKPILGIWMQSLAMATTGVHVEPGRMLEGVGGALAHPEWAVRMPFALFAMLGGYLLYKGVARWLGRRAGLLGGIALATSPHWFLVAHQSMTDMPFVASLSGAMGLVLLAAREDEAARVVGYDLTFGRFAMRLCAWHLVIGAALAVALPQIVYLLSRNVELVLGGSGPHGFRPHLDEVLVGSGLGNCNQPGDPACAVESPASPFEPWMQALVWIGAGGALLGLCRGERRRKRLFWLAAWCLAGIATMAKGPAGLAIPAVCALGWLCATRRWKELPHVTPVAGLLIVGILVGPWFVAMLVRHGSAFTDELIFHDMYSRAFEHVHDTNSGADLSFAYYVEQLGYGLFPWTGFVPLGLFAWLRRTRREGDDAAVLLLVWFVLSFALFSAMGTKFHHYILPAAAPAAVLAGVALDSFFSREAADDPHARAMMGASAIASACLVALIARDLVRTGADGHAEGPVKLIQLFTYRYDRPWPHSLDLRLPILATAVAATAICLGLVMPRLRRVAAGAWVAMALAWGAWGLDVYLPTVSPHWGQRAIMDAYYTRRAGPEEPLVAYDMNWKGENFYTSNRIAQFGTPTPPPGTPAFGAWIKDQRDKGATVMYFVTEQGRVGGLRGELHPRRFDEMTTKADCNQFVLVRAEL